MRRDSQGNTALHYVRTESQSLRKLLIDAGGDVMTTNNANHTPAVGELLMDFEEDDIFLDCNIVNGNGQSLLEILGPRSGHSASRGALSQRELDANQQMHLPFRDSNGQTALHLAAMHGWSWELTVAGEFNAKYSCGFTPLHCLMTRGPEEFHESIFNLLVSKCNVDAVNLDGQTALHMAASHDFSKHCRCRGPHQGRRQDVIAARAIPSTYSMTYTIVHATHSIANRQSGSDLSIGSYAA